MNKALPLHEYIYEETLPAKRRMEIIFNLAELYNQEFSMELVENCFDFPETVVGDNWENWKTVGGELYHLLDSGELYDGTMALFPTPATIGDFINDCNRIWKKDLIWDGNLIKRNFKLIL